MAAQECTSFPQPKNLKDILELLEKLYNAETTKKNVFQQLKSYLQGYCSASYLEAFYGSRGGSSYGYSYSGSGSILLLTQAGQNVSEEILQNPSWSRSFSDPHTGQTCIKKYFNALKECLPKAFAALLFLFFNCDSDCRNFGGGHWNSMQVKDSGTPLYHWLIAGSDSDGFIARGFSGGDLDTSNDGQNVANPLKKAVSLRPSSTEGSLQNVLCGFMFVCKWDPALTGHAICFLSTFCSNVSQGSEDLFQDPYKEHSGAFKDVCKGLKNSLKPFINGSSGLSAVGHGNTKLFDNLWDNGKFLTYCDWLKRNIYRIIASLVSMSLEPPGWSLSTIQSASSAGPFKYGFVFNGSWQASSSKSKLQGCFSKLTGEDSGSLQNFIKFLEHPSTPSSSAATAAGAAGGIFGLGGAGAGAAYGLNLFGFKNLVTGLISSFLK
ncbi:secreted antigen 1 [Babesia divergens]|uniref:Secreted antigen 1 n=1 Tax=Babesia divergens TaxID=32595 RepID=A0AAD9GID8_BABDI|nr:secreted antigen 1 [Babesia divergens]